MKNKSKNKKVSQKTNINIKINNGDRKPRRRQYTRRKPQYTPPPSYNHIPFGVNLGYMQNPFTQRDNEEFNKKMLSLLDKNKDDMKMLTSSVIQQIKDITPEMKTNESLSLKDLNQFANSYEKNSLLPKLFKTFVSKDELNNKKLKEIVEWKDEEDEKKEQPAPTPTPTPQIAKKKMTRSEVLQKARMIKAKNALARNSKYNTDILRNIKETDDRLTSQLGMVDEDYLLRSLRY